MPSTLGESVDDRKTVLITGAGVGGIGGELAKEFHRKGYRVFATARRLETVIELEDAFGIEILPLDVTCTANIQSVRDEIALRTGGRLDVLVNNAGYSRIAAATDLEIDTVVKDMFETNLFGVMRMVQEFVALLIAAEGGGTIVNVGSIAGVMPYVFGSAYGASKAALHSYADCLRVELAPFGVKVITVITGGISSNIARHSIASSFLPSTSLYLPIISHFRARAGNSQVNAQSATDYARAVVRQVMKPDWRKPLWYWRGHFAKMAWFVSTFLWKGAFDYGMKKKFGLLEMRKKWLLTERERKKGEGEEGGSRVEVKKIKGY
ncbi:uncharacterized protein LAJ45_03911 [Morchella importuna]|uniref:uncharacterized protein n=1 Tax=Morchella importuna TaxID=1174673 RepID=UPI001E8D91C5|nr:uncharacterized protein LAJ45_03911 [Morchella importuna]KAH8151918.1 hypothetical protein LAJ45_03911 [Morchella importuna]